MLLICLNSIKIIYIILNHHFKLKIVLRFYMQICNILTIYSITCLRYAHNKH